MLVHHHLDLVVVFNQKRVLVVYEGEVNRLPHCFHSVEANLYVVLFGGTLTDLNAHVNVLHQTHF
jgi:hypothetical protein